MEAFLGDARERLSSLRVESLDGSVARVRDALRAIEAFAERAAGEGREYAESRARAFSYAVARSAAGLILLEYAQWSIAAGGDQSALVAAARWCAGDLAPLEKTDGPVPSPMLIG
jgi:hypothetical protein